MTNHVQIHLDSGDILMLNFNAEKPCSGIAYYIDIEQEKIPEDVIEFANFNGCYLSQPKTEKMIQWKLFNATPEQTLEEAEDMGYEITQSLKDFVKSQGAK